MKDKYFRLFHYKNGIETEVVKVSNLYNLFLGGYLSRYDLDNVFEAEKSSIQDEDYYAIQLRQYRYEHSDGFYIVADESGVSVPAKKLEATCSSFMEDFSDVDADGLFGVPDVVRGEPVEGTGKTFFFRKLKALQCLNEKKQTCNRYLDEFEPDVRPSRKHHNIGCWEDDYYFREHQSKNWKNYRKKQYK